MQPKAWLDEHMKEHILKMVRMESITSKSIASQLKLSQANFCALCQRLLQQTPTELIEAAKAELGERDLFNSNMVK